MNRRVGNNATLIKELRIIASLCKASGVQKDLWSTARKVLVRSDVDLEML